jgi:hypothetical protein
VLSIRQSPRCHEHYGCAYYTDEITRLGARLTEVEAKLRKLRRVARLPPPGRSFQTKGEFQRKITSRCFNPHERLCLTRCPNRISLWKLEQMQPPNRRHA